MTVTLRPSGWLVDLVGAVPAIKTNPVADEGGNDFACRNIPKLSVVNAHGSDGDGDAGFGSDLHLISLVPPESVLRAQVCSRQPYGPRCRCSLGLQLPFRPRLTHPVVQARGSRRASPPDCRRNPRRVQ